MDLSMFEKDRSQNCLIESKIDNRLLNEPCWLGIDEAGRGPVLGPMVYGMVFSPLSDKEKFSKMEFADSKTLTLVQREKKFDSICDNASMIGWMVHILSPAYISCSMLQRVKYNLNALSHDTAIALIKAALDRGVKISQVYVDTVGDATKYQNKLKDLFPFLDITVSKKADALFSIVGAASICAKVARDMAVRNWEFSEGIHVLGNDFGSGYPADPVTKKFLSENVDPVFGFPDFVRFSWSTATTILEKKAVSVSWEDDEDDSHTTANNSLLYFFNKREDGGVKVRHRFFTNRALTTLTDM